jgi:hypothetical protein
MATTNDDLKEAGMDSLDDRTKDLEKVCHRARRRALRVAENERPATAGSSVRPVVVGCLQYLGRKNL